MSMNCKKLCVLLNYHSTNLIQCCNLVFKPTRSGSEDGTMAVEDPVSTHQFDICMVTRLQEAAARIGKSAFAIENQWVGRLGEERIL